MSETVRIVILDDDPLMRIAHLIFTERPKDRWLYDYFAPEEPDLSSLITKARGLRTSDGADIRLGYAGATDADIIIFRRGSIGRDLLARNPNLRLVQRMGERHDMIDIAASAKAGVWVSCLPRITIKYTAEHTLLLIQALAKQLLESDQRVREGRFDPGRLRPLDDVSYNWAGLTQARGLWRATLGIIGLGEVGTSVAQLARSFGMRVLYFSRHRVPEDQEQFLGIDYMPLANLLAEADFVSLHVVNVPGNHGLAGRDFFSNMKKGAFFVNTSRGRLVDEDALFDALESGHLAGAGLDVHQVEPRPIGDRFCRLPNVILTPHVAGGSIRGLLDELGAMLDNCRAVLSGKEPSNLVLPKH